MWLAILALLACGTTEPEVAPPPPPPTAKRPNVLVILWDTVRADHLSLYGYDRPTTPRVGAWAEGATVYEQAWSPETWTVPAHGSIFTGLPATTHGAHGGHRWLDARHETVAELLAAQGYQTWAFSANLYVGSVANLLQGFEVVHTSYPRQDLRRGRYVADSLTATASKVLPEDASTEISPRFAGNGSEKWDKSTYKDAAPVLARGLIDALDEGDPDRPWLAYLNFMEAHTPRIPSAASREALLAPEARSRALKTDMSLFRENAWMVGQHEYTPEELQAFTDVYDAALRDLDRATGDLLDELGRRGVLDDTVVVLVSDHGESLGEHRMLEHRWAIHEPLLHVPLVIRYPDGGFGPRRVSEPISTIDLFATLLDLASVPPPAPAGHYSRTLRDPSGRDVIYSELVHAYAAQLGPIHQAYPQLDLSPWKRTWRAARRGDLKLALPSDGPAQLYDLKVDPGELRDLAGERPEDTRTLEANLRAWVSDRAPYVEGEEPGNMSAEERAQLAILGYLEDEE